MDSILPSSIPHSSPDKMSPEVHIYDASIDGSSFPSPIQEDMIKTTILELPMTPARPLPPKKKKKKRNVCFYSYVNPKLLCKLCNAVYTGSLY